ncbi:hypothetical protein ACOSQ3_009561 [Xanthoceras sorbifolium]
MIKFWWFWVYLWFLVFFWWFGFYCGEKKQLSKMRISLLQIVISDLIYLTFITKVNFI